MQFKSCLLLIVVLLCCWLFHLIHSPRHWQWHRKYFLDFIHTAAMTILPPQLTPPPPLLLIDDGHIYWKCWPTICSIPYDTTHHPCHHPPQPPSSSPDHTILPISPPTRHVGWCVPPVDCYIPSNSVGGCYFSLTVDRTGWLLIVIHGTVMPRQRWDESVVVVDRPT